MNLKETDDIKFSTLEEDVSFEYPKGTRVVSIRVPHGSKIERVGEFLLLLWVEKWQETLPVECRFLTIGYTTTEMLIELSDRLRY